MCQYFSRLILPEGVDHYKTHKYLHAFFPNSNKREFIFRQDGSRVLLLSVIKPDMECNSIAVEKSVYTFAIRCNPAFKNKETGKIRHIIKSKERWEWLNEKLKDRGVIIRYSEIVDSQDVSFLTDRGDKVWFIRADMRGVLEVTDPELFSSTLMHGIGFAKAWGCGMIYLPEIMRLV